MKNSCPADENNCRDVANVELYCATEHNFNVTSIPGNRDSSKCGKRISLITSLSFVRSDQWNKRTTTPGPYTTKQCRFSQISRAIKAVASTNQFLPRRAEPHKILWEFPI
ncbi:hypothetical protein PUN28_012153 [Cardiocondyla obscurior]|uniref:Uncharacterized protein n=1 Tax=Cardiocondyla obscurior TaxID=286306 RepID=A0AAW2FCP0_9HYME